VKKLPPLNIVLYQPEIPQNTGNVGRSCLAAGAHLWLVRPLGFRIDEKHLRRAGLDYWQHLAWTAVDDWQELSDSLPVENHWYFTKSAETLYTEVNYQPGDSLVFGCETSGLPPSVTSSRPDRCLRIPIHNPVRSLNLASAVAVGTFEVLRQWREHGLIPRDF
jgi:tRNA (cytidine/uridine-2'-O-)-methyltransferase